MLLRILRAQLPLWFYLPLIIVVMIAGTIGGFLAGQRSAAPCPLGASTCAEFGTFWQAWNLLSEHYVDPEALTADTMIHGAIGGMVDSLGDAGHTRYLSPEAARSERESMNGTFEGIGAFIDIRDGQPLIVAPIEGSPAEKAGIQAGDLILQVNQQDVRGLTIDELRGLVRGPRGTTVTLQLQRTGQAEPFEITVTRAEIDIPAVSWRMLEGNIAHIHLNQFSSRAGSQMRETLSAASTAGATAIILDLRNNPGGFVEQLTTIASEFMPAGTTILIEQDRDGKQTPLLTKQGGTALDIPLVVLVNQNSASSAEILAGSLREAGRARVIGMPTFGTATVLRTYSLENGGELRIGTTQWLTPKGELVRGIGIKPDEQLALATDSSLLSPADAAALSPAALRESGDVQLLRALEILRGRAD
jgi:carboxyl-terminal processing protease